MMLAGLSFFDDVELEAAGGAAATAAADGSANAGALTAATGADPNVSDEDGNYPLHWLIAGSTVAFTLKGAACKLRLPPLCEVCSRAMALCVSHE